MLLEDFIFSPTRVERKGHWQKAGTNAATANKREDWLSKKCGWRSPTHVTVWFSPADMWWWEDPAIEYIAKFSKGLAHEIHKVTGLHSV